MFLFSALLYNLAFSGAFISFNFSTLVMSKLLYSSIVIFAFTVYDFIGVLYGIKSRIFSIANRIFCSFIILLYIFLPTVFIFKIYKIYFLYLFGVLFYCVFLSVRDTFILKKNEFSFIMTVAIFVGVVSGFLDVLSALGITSTPQIFCITISSMAVASCVVTILEFINISSTNKRLTVTLGQANEDLKEMDRVKSEFLANTSHELRTPLNGILGLAEAILDGADGKINDKMNNHLSMITKSAGNLKNLVGDILDLSKMQSGKQKLAVKKIEIAKIMEEVIPVCDGLVIDKSYDIKINVDKLISVVYADKGKIRQVLVNLIGNAVKFTAKRRC